MSAGLGRVGGQNADRAVPEDTLLSFVQVFHHLVAHLFFCCCPPTLPHRESKTLQSVSRHYTAKWTAPGQAAPQLRFHAASDQAGRQLKGTCWGPDIGKGVTVSTYMARPYCSL